MVIIYIHTNRSHSGLVADIFKCYLVIDCEIALSILIYIYNGTIYRVLALICLLVYHHNVHLSLVLPLLS